MAEKKRVVKNTKIDKQRAIQLKTEHNLSYADIARIQGVSPAGVQRAIADILPAESTQRYIAHRSDILARAQEKLLLALDSDKIKSMSGLQIVTALGILYDKEQLEKGISKEKPPVMVVVKGDNATVTVGEKRGRKKEKKIEDDVIDV